MKPILFNTEMVQAILQGRKTQTRRIVMPQPSSGVTLFRGSPFVKSGLEDGHGREIKVPYQPGDILYVREAFRRVTVLNSTTFESRKELWYKADHKGASIPRHDKWKPSIHMPKEAARIFLRVKSVWVERLCNISEGDAIAEGIKPIEWSRMMPDSKFEDYTGRPRPEDYTHGLNAIESFCSLWESINGEESWNANPWVWVIEFEEIPDPR